MQQLPQSLVDLFTEARKPEPTNQVSFLLGSGFSRADKLPLVGDINAKLAGLKENDFFLGQETSAWFYTDKYRDPNHKMTWYERQFAEEFIAFYVETQCGNDTNNFNYEVFFDYFNEFLYEKKHMDAVYGFGEYFKNKHKVTGELENIRQYLSKFLNIFNQLVASMLRKAKYYQDITFTGGYPNYEEFSKLLSQLLKDNIVTVHSLNHDMLFDHLANNVSGIFQHYSDGFTEMNSPYYGEIQQTLQIDGLSFYKSYKVRLKYFNNIYKGRLRFYKLHGSVDTFPLYQQGSKEHVTIKRDYGVDEIFKEVTNEDTGQYEYTSPFTNKYPSFLTGTTQKIKRYGDPFYADLFNHFKKNLIASNKLIVIGYGFQDAGINEILEEYYLSQGKEIFVVDIKIPASELIKKYDGQFTITGTGVGETSYDKFQTYLKG